MSKAPMAEEGFFRRWSRLKSEGGDAPPAPQPAAPAPAAPSSQVRAGTQARADAGGAAPRPAPTLDDVASLSFESDYSGFVAEGVDKAVRRLALKKLFADPHFKVMDGLDIYIDDYNKPSPLSPDMLAQLQHAQRALGRLLDEGGQEGGEAERQAQAAPELQAEPGPQAQPEPGAQPGQQAQAEQDAAPPSTQGKA